MTAASTSEQVSAALHGNQTADAQEVNPANNQGKVEETVAGAVTEQATAEHGAAENRVPTDEELAEALRLLTPVHGAASAEAKDSVSSEQRSALVGSAGQNEAGVPVENGARWHAVPVDLGTEEMSVSLEAEMFRAVVPEPATTIVPRTIEASPAQSVMTADVNAVSEVSSAPHAEMPPPLAASAPPVVEAAKETDSEKRQESPVSENAMGPAPVETAPATSASHVTIDSGSPAPMESGAEQLPEHASGAHASLERNEEAIGDEESMSKHAKTDHGKSSKSGWHQIHAAMPTPSSDVEAAKRTEAEPATEQNTKAMAAAAAGDDASRPGAAADPNAIASIVDSVLADLRPRIVEEIARKLAKK